MLLKDDHVLPRKMEGENDPGLIIQKKLRYPVIAAKKGITGKVIVSFIIKTDGKITDIRVVKNK